MAINAVLEPEFEIILDEETNELIDVKFQGQTLSDILPVIYGVNIKSSCSSINSVDLNCAGSASITYQPHED